MSNQGVVFSASITSIETAGDIGVMLNRHVHPDGTDSVSRHPFHTDVLHPGQLSAEESEDSRYVHPQSLKLFRSCNGKMNWIRKFPILGGAIETYGPWFILTLDTTYFFSKGIAYGLVGIAINPLFLYRYNCTSLEYQRYYTVSRMGWSIKPFTAVISDSLSFFGYKKRWFLTFSAVLGGVFSIAMAALPATHASSIPAAVFSLLVGYGQANVDILSEGLYSRKMRRWPAAGPKLVSSVWVMIYIAGIISSCIQGPVTDAGLPQVGMYICGVAMLVCIPFFAVNGMDEETNRTEREYDAMMMKKQRAEERKEAAEREKRETRKEVGGGEAMYSHTLNDGDLVDQKLQFEEINEVLREEGESSDDLNKEKYLEDDEDEELVIPTYCGGRIEFNKEVIVRNWRLALFSAVMTGVVVATAIITLLSSSYPLLGISIAGTIILNGMMFWSLPPVVAKAGLFGFINQALYVNINGPLQSFYISDEKCNPGGPDFSYTFFNTTTGIIGYVTGTIGVIAFSYIFSKRSYRLTFCVTVFAEIVGSVFDLILVKRWNLPAIPDHYMYVFGDSVIYQVAYMFAWMPFVVLLAQLCPRGSEAIVYSLLAANSNFGQTIAGEIGTLLMQFVWPVPADLEEGVCNFSNLWKLIIFGHMGLPFGIIISVFFLIPRARICDELDPDTGKAVHREKVNANENVAQGALGEEGGEAASKKYEDGFES